MNSEDLSEDSILQNSAYNGKDTVISDEGANATSGSFPSSGSASNGSGKIVDKETSVKVPLKMKLKTRV